MKNSCLRWISDERQGPQIYPFNKLDNAWFHRYLLFFLYSAGAVAEFKELTAAMDIMLEENRYFRELSSILRVLRARAEELTQ